jgi:hypothetical protein
MRQPATRPLDIDESGNLGRSRFSRRKVQARYVVMCWCDNCWLNCMLAMIVHDGR